MKKNVIALHGSEKAAENKNLFSLETIEFEKQIIVKTPTSASKNREVKALEKQKQIQPSETKRKR